MDKNDQSFLAREIRTRYTGEEHTRLDELKQLDRKARRPAGVFAWIFGGAGAIVMGSGMSLVMTDIGAVVNMAEPMPVGIVIGVVGLVMAAVNYPIYKRILSSRRRKYAGQIIALSDEIMKG